MAEGPAFNKLGVDPKVLTVADAIEMHAASTPQNPAVVFPDCSILTYRGLQRQIDRIGNELKRAGIGAGTRVAIVVPDGPELAIAITAVACHATAVPLDPNLTNAELDELFVSEQLEAVILANWAGGLAREVATRHGVCQLEATRLEGGIQVALLTPPLLPPTTARKIAPDDAAFILRTSGTSARPKLVAVSHRNLLATASGIQAWFALTPRDRVLCVMPLYYAIGLKIALFTPLISGGSVACPSRSSEGDLFSWLAELEPTWYSAGPTIHRSVLDRGRALGDRSFRHNLRFVHSGAAPLPDAVHDGLEALFGVPVLHTYGLSEAGLVAANSFASEGRRRGTVGKPIPGELAIWTFDHGIVEADVLGEIVVRGPGVTPGYIDDPEANRAAFVDGWFHTGDLGRIDTDGFLHVVGRIKELINRGGEKIAPVEIDEALLKHPAVADAAAFPVSHPRLGEDVAAAVILRAGQAVTPLDLRRYLRTMLAPFKIPRRIHIVADLPKGDTGKVRRPELSRIYGSIQNAHSASPTGTSLEIEIAEIWKRLLGRDDIGRDDEFFELGGDSLLATQMLLEAEQLTGMVLPANILFETTTIRQFAQTIVEKEGDADQSLLVKVQPGTDRSPFVFVDGDFWGGGFYTRKLAQLLGSEYPFYNLRSHGLHADSIPSIPRMAKDYMGLVTAAQPRGPYRIGGHCNGALIAWELVRQLEAAGERVELLTLIEPITLNARPSMRSIAGILDSGIKLAARDPEKRAARVGSAMSLAWRAVRKADRLLHEREEKIGDSVDAIGVRLAQGNERIGAKFFHLYEEFRRAMAGYVPGPIAAEVHCLVAESHGRSAVFSGKVLRPLTPRLDIEIVPGEHLTCITMHAETLAGRMRTRLAELDRRASGAR
jgi:oxalate---CoA ligase